MVLLEGEVNHRALELLDRDCHCMFRLTGQGSTASVVDGLGFGGLNDG